MSSARAAVLLIAALSAAPALAQEAPAAQAPVPALAAAPAAAPAPVSTPAEPVSSRELGGHVFQPSVSVNSAFATTEFSTYLVAGYGSTTGTFTLTLPDGTIQTVDGNVDYGAIGGFLHYQVRVLDSLAVRVHVSEALYTGITGAAAAVVGTNARIGGGFGLTWSIPLTEKLRLAALADVTYAPNMGLLLGPALKQVYDTCSGGAANCEFDVSKLFNQENVLELKPAAALAWAPTPSLGVTANLGWTQMQQVFSGAQETTIEAGGVDGGLSLDFDLGKLTSVPLGLQANVATRVPVSGASTMRFTDVGGALLYTGRKDLSAGLHVVTRRFRVVPEVDVSWATFLVTTGLTYYW